MVPLNTCQRHWSIIKPKGIKAILSNACFNNKPMSFDASGTVSSNPIFCKYLGVIDNAIVSPMASWKPSLAEFLKING